MTPTVTVIVVILGLAVVFLGMLVVGMLRSHAEILSTLAEIGYDTEHGNGPTSGSDRSDQDSRTEHNHTTASVIVGVSGLTPDGESVALALKGTSGLALLAFLSGTCSSCEVFWQGLDRPENAFGIDGLRPIVVTLGPEEESPTRISDRSNSRVPVVMSTEAWDELGVPGAPHFVLVDTRTGSVLGEGTSNSIDALGDFVRDSLDDLAWSKRVSRPRADLGRESRVDRELLEAGIQPGDEQLRHTPGSLEDPPLGG
ncbi:MAG: hypothetical protein GEU79_05365 [Acidimicrobiia bacterium]|nr:hypothetical protein [Acidimicrobiia bacterium]